MFVAGEREKACVRACVRALEHACAHVCVCGCAYVTLRGRPSVCVRV